MTPLRDRLTASLSSLGDKRMFLLFLLMIGGAAFGSGYVLVSEQANDLFPPTGGPRLERSAGSVLNLGEGKVDEVLTGRFNLRNLGTKPLDFQIKAGCNCAQLQPQAGQIAPGESEEVIVGVRLRFEGVRERVRLRIETNDPKTPQAEYVIEANCPAPFEVSPASVVFGSVGEGEALKAVLTVRDAHGAPLTAATDLCSRTDNPHVSVEPLKGEERERQLVVRLLPTAPRGYLQTEITLTLSETNASMRIPVSAYIVGPVAVAPQTLLLPDRGGETKFFVWRPNEKPLGELRHLDVPRGIVVDELSDRAAARRRFRVRNAGFDGSGGPQSIRLRFEALSEEVVVNIFADKPAEK